MNSLYSLWNTDDPPKDGTPIVAIGKIMFRDDFSTAADPFLSEISYQKIDSGYEGWILPSGLSLAQALDDVVIIHYWMPYPKESEVSRPRPDPHPPAQSSDAEGRGSSRSQSIRSRLLRLNAWSQRTLEEDTAELLSLQPAKRPAAPGTKELAQSENHSSAQPKFLEPGKQEVAA